MANRRTVIKSVLSAGLVFGMQAWKASVFKLKGLMPSVSAKGGWFVITSTGQTVSAWIETSRRFQSTVLLARDWEIGLLFPFHQPLHKPALHEQHQSINGLEERF